MSALMFKPDLSIIDSNPVDKTAAAFYQYYQILSKRNYITTAYDAKYVYSAYKINAGISFSMIHINIMRKTAKFNYKANNRKSSYKQTVACFNKDFISILEDYLCYTETEDILVLFGN